MLRNKKGAALMQVLLVTAILAGMATLMLRASLSRTSSVRQTRQTVSTELVIESCQAQINMMWSKKKPDVFKRDLSGCWMNCDVKIAEENLGWKSDQNYKNSKCYSGTQGMSSHATRSYTCKVPVAGSATPIDVVATFSQPSDDDESSCRLTYTLKKTDSERM